MPEADLQLHPVHKKQNPGPVPCLLTVIIWLSCTRPSFDPQASLKVSSLRCIVGEPDSGNNGWKGGYAQLVSSGAFVRESGLWKYDAPQAVFLVTARA